MNNKYEEFDNIYTNNLNITNLYNNDENNNNIININNINCKNLLLNTNNNKNTLITKNENMDINIILTTTKIGTKYILILTKNQNSLEISFKNENYKIKGNYNIYNNTNTITEQKKKFFIKSEKENKIFYIPNKNLGLYGGSIILLEYININEWKLEGNLIGNISYELNLLKKINEL